MFGISKKQITEEYQEKFDKISFKGLSDFFMGKAIKEYKKGYNDCKNDVYKQRVREEGALGLKLGELLELHTGSSSQLILFLNSMKGLSGESKGFLIDLLISLEENDKEIIKGREERIDFYLSDFEEDEDDLL